MALAEYLGTEKEKVVGAFPQFDKSEDWGDWAGEYGTVCLKDDTQVEQVVAALSVLKSS